MSMQQQIQQKLRTFDPVHLEVINESNMHSVPPGSETHFKVVLVSSQLDGKRQVARHQMVYRTLANELASGVHALALHTYTPAEWRVQTQSVPASPQCMGGGKHDH